MMNDPSIYVTVDLQLSDSPTRVRTVQHFNITRYRSREVYIGIHCELINNINIQGSLTLLFIPATAKVKQKKYK